MNLGFIGTGIIARSHLEHFDDMEGVSITAVCDVDETAARGAGEPRGASTFTDHETMYEERGDDLDAVVICIPPFAHTTQETMAAERGIPFLVEKPLALSLEKARSVRQAVDGNDIVTQVGYQRRYHPAVERTKELLGDGQVALVDGQRQSPVPDKGWWKQKAKSGGQMVEMTTHDFDLTRHIAGEVDRVRTYGAHEIVDEIDFEDATATVMEHETGAISDLSASSASPDWNSSFTVVGEGCRLTFDYMDGRLSGTVDGEEIDLETDVDPRAEQDRAFVEAVRKSDPNLPRSPYHDAVRTLEVTLAATESIERGEEIILG